jgi:hypothetical protein
MMLYIYHSKIIKNKYKLLVLNLSKDLYYNFMKIIYLSISNFNNEVIFIRCILFNAPLILLNKLSYKIFQLNQFFNFSFEII